MMWLTLVVGIFIACGIAFLGNGVPVNEVCESIVTSLIGLEEIDPPQKIPVESDEPAAETRSEATQTEELEAIEVEPV